MESASDYFDRDVASPSPDDDLVDSGFREAVAVTARDYLLGRHGWGGLAYLVFLGYVAFSLASPGTASVGAGTFLGILVGMFKLVRPQTRVNEVDETTIRVEQRGGWLERDRTIQVADVVAVEVVHDDGWFTSFRRNPFGIWTSDDVYWVNDGGVLVETADDEFYVRSTRPEEFASAIRAAADVDSSDRRADVRRTDADAHAREGPRRRRAGNESDREIERVRN